MEKDIFKESKNYYHVKEVRLEKDDILRLQGTIMCTKLDMAQLRLLQYKEVASLFPSQAKSVRNRPRPILGAYIYDITNDRIIQTVTSTVLPFKYSVRIIYNLYERGDHAFPFDIQAGSFDDFERALHALEISYNVHRICRYGGGVYCGVKLVNTLTEEVYKQILY